MREDQVELINVDGASRYAVYFTKQADSLLTTIPGVMPIAAAKRPSTSIILADFGLNIPGLGMTVRTDTLAKKKDAIRRFVSVVCGAWTYILDGHEQEGAEAVFAKKPNGVFTAAMMAVQIRSVQTVLLYRRDEGHADRPAERSRLDADIEIHGRGQGRPARLQAVRLFHERLHRTAIVDKVASAPTDRRSA